VKDETKKEKRENKGNLFLKKRRYLSVLLFLVFVLCNFAGFTKISSAALTDAERIQREEIQKNITTQINNNGAMNTPASAQSPGLINQAAGAAAGLVGGWMLQIFNLLLYAVYIFIGILANLAGILFDWVVNPKVFISVMNLNAIKTGWYAVRDFLNLAFIMVLLFSAFCTIFQVQKYNLKKVLITLVIMALLVNFSFPIARFFIDASNVMMYFFLNKINIASISAGMANWSSLNESAVGPIGKTWEVTLKLIAGIIFLFMFAVTLLTMAILLVIRMLVLAIVIIFSPVGFVGYIFPGLSQFAGKWWDALFKQAFFGPIMAFFIYLAFLIMTEFNANPKGTEKLGVVQGIIVAGVHMALPITLLWVGMISAKQLGATGAATAQKYGMGAMKKFSGVNAVQKRYKAYRAERDKRVAEKFKGNLGERIGKGLNKAQDTAHGLGSYETTDPITGKKTRHSIIPGAKRAKERAENMVKTEHRKNAEDEAKKITDSGVTIDNIAVEVNNAIDAAGNVKAKVAKEQAGSARAYVHKSSDDKKDFIEDELKGKTTIAGTKLQNILAGAATNPRVNAALTKILSGGVYEEKDLRAVATYVSLKSEEVMKKYVET
jgi:hypothetical protein